MENINNDFDILSFTADQLSINNPAEPTTSGSYNNIYRPRPADSKSEDGIYRAQIKVIYNPFNLKNSILEQQSYALQDENGFFTVVSSLTVNDTNCPIFKAWKTCHYSKDPVLLNQQKSKDEGGRGLFDKRYARYVVIQVLDDPNNSDLNGKYMFWKMPKAVWEVINAKQSPTNPAKAPIPIMDFLFGRALDIEVIPGPGKPGDQRYSRETSYRCELSDDPVSCVNPDMSSLLTPEQQEILDKYIEDMKAVWKEKDPEVRNANRLEIDKSENTVKLREFYRDVIEKIKSFCPNLIETLGYNPWTPEVTERVNNWIKIVLSGNDPTIPNLATVSEAINSIPETMTTTDANNALDDDLPF